jgi:hypothetical protein
MAQEREPLTPAQALETLNSLTKTVGELPASPDPEVVKDLVEKSERALETLKREYVVDPKPGRRQRLRQKFS